MATVSGPDEAVAPDATERPCTCGGGGGGERGGPEDPRQSKTEFLSTLSHELRTPLNAIVGLSECLLEIGPETDPSRARRYLEAIRDAGQLLREEIEDMLDFAEVDSGALAVSKEKIDLARLCRSVHAGMQSCAGAKQLALELELPAGEILVEADGRLLGRAIRKLLVNAVKFTPRGGSVTLTLAARPGEVRIVVNDTGIGIAADKLSLLFKPFSQVDSSLSRRFGGAGIGLVLVERFIRLHGGHVEVESRPVCGSTFTIVLPVRPGFVAGPAQS